MGELIPRPHPAQALDFDGERFTTSFGGQTAIEHWHRYLLARELVRGFEVLDIACGEGYGAALLAQTARQVVGVDLSALAVAHAQKSYVSENLRFLEGSALAIPMADASVDAVISFETLEHFREQDRFLAEVRRVLRPGGLLIISTPDRDNYSPAGTAANPFHQLELTIAEFSALLSRHFSTVRMQGQRILLGSILLGENCGTGVPLVFERRGESHFEASSGPARAKYVIAIATDGDLPAFPDSAYVDSDRLLHIDGPFLDRIVAGGLPPGIAEQIATLEAKVIELLSYIAERDRVIREAAEVRTDLEKRLVEASTDIAQLRWAWEIARKDSQRLATELGAAEVEMRQMSQEAETMRLSLEKARALV